MNMYTYAYLFYTHIVACYLITQFRICMFSFCFATKPLCCESIYLILPQVAPSEYLFFRVAGLHQNEGKVWCSPNLWFQFWQARLFLCCNGTNSTIIADTWTLAHARYASQFFPSLDQSKPRWSFSTERANKENLEHYQFG